jgi:acetyl-CoA carboxylase biotin carboxylase subunit
LFQRILGDADFQAAKLDTGYLDRLLAKANPAVASFAPKPEIPGLEKIATIAAGMFAVLDPLTPVGKNGNAPATGSGSSKWKQKGRSDVLR